MDGLLSVVLGVYLGLGALVAIGFILVGGPRTVPGFKGSGILFRLVILPSAAILWPILAFVWLTRPRVDVHGEEAA